MTPRANTSSGPKADGSQPVAYAIVSGVAVGLLLPVIGLLLDPHDTYFNALLPASLAVPNETHQVHYVNTLRAG